MSLITEVSIEHIRDLIEHNSGIKDRKKLHQLQFDIECEVRSLVKEIEVRTKIQAYELAITGKFPSERMFGEGKHGAWNIKENQ